MGASKVMDVQVQSVSNGFGLFTSDQCLTLQKITPIIFISPGLLLIKDPQRRSMYYIFHQSDALCQSEQSAPN